MVIRGEQSLKYDAENRLTEISRNNTAIQQNYYDHTGHRVLKKLPDGTHVYNINGLYELGQKAGYADTHTKYIYGMKGDIAAQVTKESSKVKKTRFYSGTLYDGRYHSNGAVRLASGAIIAVNEFADTPGNIWKVERWVIGTLVLSLMLLLLYSSKKRGITILRLPEWSEAISMLLVISLVTSMTLTGCTGGDIPGVSDDTEDTENTVTDSTGAIPAKGLYYFHPNHVGSISYLTDSTGKIVSKMNYTPYGEIIKSKSTGTDLFNKKYTGQTYDASSSMKDGEEDTGLCYYNARYYDPGIGRFISADTLVPNPYNSQSFNRYMYVLGNPIRYNDPSGHVPGPGGTEPDQAETDTDTSDDSGIGGTDSSLGEATDDSSSLGVSYSGDTPVGSDLTDGVGGGELTAGSCNFDFGGIASAVSGFITGKKPNGRSRGGLKDSSDSDSISHDSGGDHSGSVNIGDKVSANNKGFLERLGESMHSWAKDARQPLQNFGEYLGRNRTAGLAACFGAAAFGAGLAPSVALVVSSVPSGTALINTKSAVFGVLDTYSMSAIPTFELAINNYYSMAWSLSSLNQYYNITGQLFQALEEIKDLMNK